VFLVHKLESLYEPCFSNLVLLQNFKTFRVLIVEGGPFGLESFHVVVFEKSYRLLMFTENDAENDGRESD